MKKPFYGYLVAFGCFVIMFLHVGGLGTFSVFMPAIAKDVGLTIANLSLVITIASISGFGFSLVGGKIMQAITPRWALFLASLAVAGNFLLYAISKNTIPMYIGAVLSGFAVACGSQASNAAIISQWFIEKRSTVLGVVFGSSALGSAVLLLISGILIDRQGWRGAYFTLTVIVLAIALPVNLLLLRSPEKMGQKPLGWEKAGQETKASGAVSAGVDVKTARSSACFWLLFLAMVLVGTLVNGFKSFAPSFWQSNGMSPLDSSRYVSIFMLLSTIASLVSGTIADKFGNKIYITYLHFAFLAGMALVITSASSMNPLYLYTSILIVGISYPLSGSVPATLTTQAFGGKDYAKICALLMAGYYGGVALVPPLMGMTFGATGSYVPAFMVLIAFAAVSLVLILLGLKLSPLNKTVPAVTAAAAEES